MGCKQISGKKNTSIISMEKGWSNKPKCVWRQWWFVMIFVLDCSIWTPYIKYTWPFRAHLSRVFNFAVLTLVNNELSRISKIKYYSICRDTSILCRLKRRFFHTGSGSLNKLFQVDAPTSVSCYSNTSLFASFLLCFPLRSIKRLSITCIDGYH